ncbi:adhesion G protein-coupled receptor E3-like isoform X2, partial [Silurus meridionalis]
VENYLNIMMNITSLVKENTTDQDLILYGNDVLDFTEELVSKLVKETDDIQSISIPLQSLVAVVLMSFTNMAAILHASFFNAFVYTTKTIISPVVSAKLLQVSGFTTIFSKVNFTLKHVDELDPKGFLSCVYWNRKEWVEDGCNIRRINRTHTLCSCDHLGTFATIQKTFDVTYVYYLMYSSWPSYIKAFAAVGMLFLSLSILTLAIYRPHKKVTNMTLINLCTSILLTMIFTLLTRNLLSNIFSQQLLFAVLDCVWLFFYLSSVMWMFNKAVLLFIFVKNLSRVSSNQGEGLSCKWFILIGYLIPLVLVVMRGIVSHGICKHSKLSSDLFSSVQLILILHIISIIIIILNLIRLKNQNLLRTNSNDTKLIMSVLFKSLAQFFIFGCPWLAYFFVTGDVFFTVNLICIQQGVFIFLFHCLLNPEVSTQHF